MAPLHSIALRTALSGFMLASVTPVEAQGDPAPEPKKPAMTDEQRVVKNTLLASERLAVLPEAERRGWEAYFSTSQALARQNREALERELADAGLEKARRPKSGGDFKLPHEPGHAWFGTPEAARLADAVLSFQTPAGGWSKHNRYTEPREKGTLWSSQYEPGAPPHYLGTIDNHATTSEILLLAAVWQKTQRADCLTGVHRGLDWLLSAQYPNGGWPQNFPLEGRYHDAITFNDDAMTHVLTLLADVRDGAPHFAGVDAQHRSRVLAALERGVQCVLASQVRRGTTRTGWCAQHDPLTLAPLPARAKEPAALGAPETGKILTFLMRQPAQTPEGVAAIEAGLAWLEKVRITGLRQTKRDGKTAYDPDPTATQPLWARFYEVETDTPLFAGADDGIVYKTFNEMAAKNRVGYDYYTTLPHTVVTTQQKKWRKRRG